MYIALLSLIVYLTHMTRDIYAGDIGDLVAAACGGGVPHPPGYPLFMLLGNTLCKIPLGIPPVTRVTLISAFACAIGIWIYYRFCKRVLSNTYLSAICALTLAFSHLYWLHAEIPEVFGLNSLIVITLLALAYEYYLSESTSVLYMLAGFYGIALAHHQTVLFLAPTLAILVFSRYKSLISNWRYIPTCLGLVVVGFALPYIYVPLASSHNPLVNWGSVHDLKSLIGLIERRSYGGFAPSVKNGIPVAVKTAVINDYFKAVVTNFSYQIVALAVAGWIYLARHRKYILLIALTIAYVLTGPLFVGYAATYYTTSTAFGIIERFYTISMITLAFFLPFGFLAIDEALSLVLKKSSLRLVLLSYFLIVPIYMFYYNHPKTNLSHTHIGNNFAYDILDSLPPHAILFSSGDTTVFNLWYVQYVLHYRPDVDLINPPGVGGNVFLNNELTRYHAAHPKTKISTLMVPTLDALSVHRPIYSTYEIAERPAGTSLIPYGLVYELVKTDQTPTQEDYTNRALTTIRRYHRTRLATLTLAEQNLIATEIPLIYSIAHNRIGDYLDAHYHDPQASEKFYRLALWRNEENSSAYSGLALAQYKGFHDCTNALYNINQAIDVYPVWKTYYIQRYIIQRQCDSSSPKLREYRTQFKNVFRTDIDKLLKNQYHL